MDVYIGIDPGLKGGISFLCGSEVLPYAMPQTIADVFYLLTNTYSGKEYRRFAVLELVHASPTMASRAAFTFGTGYGVLKGALLSSQIPFIQVSPAKWQKSLGCLTKGDKNVTKTKAQELFPSVPRITHLIADSLLIAEYARRSNLLRPKEEIGRLENKTSPVFLS